MAWECTIEGCGEVFQDVEEAVVHQAADHERLECKICGTVVPDGYLSIRHAFTEHSRAEYVRAYGADSADVRQREEILEAIESTANMERIATALSQ